MRDNSTDKMYLIEAPGQVIAIRDGTALRQGGYAQQTSNIGSKRVQVVAGVRWDHLSYLGPQLFSPQTSVSVRVAKAAEVQFGFGRYLEFNNTRALGHAYFSPPLAYLPPGSTCADPGIPVPVFGRSTHYLAAFEQRLGGHSRLRLEGFNRQEGWTNGERSSCQAPYEILHLERPWYLRARGFQLVFQRRSSNRLAGWIGYTLNYVRDIRGTETGLAGTFRSMYDQRHTLNAFASYRLRPSISLSGKWMYGSGYPMPGWLTIQGGGYYESDAPSYVNMPAYARFDVRMDKTFALKQRKVTLSVEVINATNHHNMRFLGYDNYDSITHRVFPDFDRTLPILPTAGLSFEF